MGTWGAKLYDDDNASDLRDVIALVCKVPAPGDRLLELLKETYDGDCEPTDREGSLFWLVTADQFERRGIECQAASQTALSVIESGVDLSCAREEGADEKFVVKRRAVLQELANRLRSPRTFKPRVPPRNPPPLFVAPGEVYAFPTMNGASWCPYVQHLIGPFKPNGWGALVVLDTGRAFNWLPWVAIASLTVNPHRKPTLEDALKAKLLFSVDHRLGIGRFIPKPSHVRALGLEPLGQVKLDTRRVEPLLTKWKVTRAISDDYSIAYAALGPTAEHVEQGCELSSLISQAEDLP